MFYSTTTSSTSSSEDKLTSDSKGVHVSALLPITPNDQIYVTKALIVNSVIRASAIEDIRDLSTDHLTVKQQADFTCDVTIEGSLMVMGTVVGSGPYMDGSDRRFKKSLTDVHGALTAVEQLTAVSFYLC